MTALTLARMRETIEVLRQAFSGEKITYSGTQFQIPAPGEARPMRLSLAANPGIPIYIASMSPGMLELTGTVADAWLGTNFVPERSAAYFKHLDRGLAGSGRARRDLDVCQVAEVAFLGDEDAVTAHVAARKKELAFSLGGMGSASKNFYNQAHSRRGWA
jgi:alkanesulfonate monooxygenase SsuD/methylene tetrahydromethanopterin reductase-like flavin-dependent oxidoreductase (luciferase family)